MKSSVFDQLNQKHCVLIKLAPLRSSHSFFIYFISSLTFTVRLEATRRPLISSTSHWLPPFSTRRRWCRRRRRLVPNTYEVTTRHVVGFRLKTSEKKALPTEATQRVTTVRLTGFSHIIFFFNISLLYIFNKYDDSVFGRPWRPAPPGGEGRGDVLLLLHCVDDTEKTAWKRKWFN